MWHILAPLVLFVGLVHGDLWQLHWVEKSNSKTPPQSQKILTDFFADMLPKNYKYSSTLDSASKLQDHVDKAILNILQFKAGHQFCDLLNNNQKSLQLYLGMSHSGAQKASEVCVRMSGKPVGPHVGVIRTGAAQRLYWLVTIDQTDVKESPFEAWTKAGNLTAFVATPYELNNEFLTMAMIHELAVGFDSKFNIEASMFGDNNIPPAKETCDKLAAVHYPAVKFATTAIRAAMFEDQFTEVKASEFTQLLKAEPNCGEKIRKTAHKFKDLLWLFEKTDRYYESEWRQFCPFREDVKLLPKGTKGLQQAVDFISKMRVVGQNKDYVSLCEYLTTPLLGRDGIAYSKGPKPRFTGGW